MDRSRDEIDIVQLLVDSIRMEAIMSYSQNQIRANEAASAKDWNFSFFVTSDDSHSWVGIYISIFDFSWCFVLKMLDILQPGIHDSAELFYMLLSLLQDTIPILITFYFMGLPALILLEFVGSRGANSNP